MVVLAEYLESVLDVARRQEEDWCDRHEIVRRLFEESDNA